MSKNRSVERSVEGEERVEGGEELDPEPLNKKGVAGSGRKSKQIYKQQKIEKIRAAKATKYKSAEVSDKLPNMVKTVDKKEAKKTEKKEVKKTSPDPRGKHLNNDLLSAFL